MKRESASQLICLDIGNSSASYAVYRRGRLAKVGRTESSKIPEKMRQLLAERHSFPISHIVICSVVPDLGLKVRALARQREGVKFLEIGREIKLRFRHKYLNINRLGKDRVANVWGGAKIYGVPILILDYGTALTCDYISEKGVFLGGLIIPGPEISFSALGEKTALLPGIAFPVKAFRGLVARDTRGGMKSGILQAYGAMTDGLVARFRKRYGRKFRVVATGGLARVISRYSSAVDTVDPLLTLKSLRAIFLEKEKELPS
jgi:type III pantothenate kinase